MFNTSKHSSERSMRHEPSQRGSSAQRSKSARSTPNSSRHSDSRPQCRMPIWVHCEKCFVNYEMNPNMMLLSCGNIFCVTCLRVDDALLPNEKIPCPHCKTAVAYIPLASGSLNPSLRGMFLESWMDPILQINYRSMLFMMTKAQNYSQFLAKSINQNQNLPPQYKQRWNNLKKKVEHIEKQRQLYGQVTEKISIIKAVSSKKYRSIQMLRAFYERKKAEIRRQPEPQHHKQQRNYQQKDMKFISSGRNEQSNQYIGQVKSSNRPTHQNQSAANIRNFSQRVVPPPLQRQSVTLNQYRGDTSKQSSEHSSRRSTVQPATFRPKPKDFKSDNHRFEPQPHAQKRLAPSYDHDEYTNPSKRAAVHHPAPKEIILDTSISSVGSSEILNKNHYNPMTKYNNRQKNPISSHRR